MLERTQRIIVPSSTQITDAEEQQYYVAQLLSIWGYRKHINHFPGCNPVPVDRETLHHLGMHEYVVAYKTDGVRYMLLLTLRPDGAPIALMIDRALIMYEIEVWGNEHFFTKGTLLDGELTWDSLEERSLVYLVFDLIAAGGERYVHHSFADRLQVIHNTIFRVWNRSIDIQQCVSEENRIVCQQVAPVPIQFLPKHIVHAANVDDLWRRRRESPYRMDGLLFTRKDAKVSSGSSLTMLKWKTDATIDLACSGGDSVNALFMNSDSRPDLVPLLHLTHCSFTLVANKITQHASTPQPSGVCIIEYSVNATRAAPDATVAVTLVPVRERLDKNSPNSVKTVDKTIRGTLDVVTFAELKQCLASNSKNIHFRG
jgi:hypothetical protein